MRVGHAAPHRDFVLPGEVGGLAEQLRLGHGDSAGSVSDQHRVVELGSSRGGRAQVPALGTRGHDTDRDAAHSSSSQLVQTTGLCLGHPILRSRDNPLPPSFPLGFLGPPALALPQFSFLGRKERVSLRRDLSCRKYSSFCRGWQGQ